MKKLKKYRRIIYIAAFALLVLILGYFFYTGFHLEAIEVDST